MIRKCTPEEVWRIAEIIVYNNRINFYPIFGDIKYSFGEFNVKSVAEAYLADTNFVENTYVWFDQVIKGYIYVYRGEIVKLFVDPFFQNCGIGHKLIQYAIKECSANRLWVLEKNVSARRFYERHGFVLNGERVLEEDTTEYLLRMVREGETI